MLTFEARNNELLSELKASEIGKDHKSKILQAREIVITKKGRNQRTHVKQTEGSKPIKNHKKRKINKTQVTPIRVEQTVTKERKEQIQDMWWRRQDKQYKNKQEIQTTNSNL